MKEFLFQKKNSYFNTTITADSKERAKEIFKQRFNRYDSIFEFITVKSAACSEVLELMDNDFSYSKALDQVSEQFEVAKEELKKELEEFI